MPVSSSVSQWKAETRGSTIVLLIDPSAKFATWNGQLGVIFVHEIFHLWVPNFLQLKGDFDWFFEGFSLYQGLLTARELKLISSEEMLSTLGRVLDLYLSFSDEGSLIDASERRWANPTSYVYDKGMLVAFMYDLIARTQYDTRSLTDVYRELFTSFADKPVDGNEAIIGLLSSSEPTRELSERYIKGRTQLELEKFLPRYGFRVETKENRSSIKINDNLNDEQRRLVRSFGLKP
jgi:predicted metalloprotease with PDZ domain